MLKSFLYAVLKVYIYIRSDWYEPVTFFVYRKLHFLLYKKPPAGCALARIRIISKEYISFHCVLSHNSESVTIKL